VESPARPPYLDPAAPIAERVADLLSRLTLDEKIAQIITLWDGKGALLDAERRLLPERLGAAFPHGIGHVARPADSKGEGVNSAVNGRGVRATVELVNAYQQHARQHTRLAIPVLFHEEGLHGYAAPGATSFPQALAQAQAWDRELVQQCNAVTAREMRARGVHLALTPVLDIARDPRWGRIEETFGEDPYLVTELGIAAVRGLQGDGERLGPGKVYATLKHLAGHGAPEGGINVGPAPIAERELREAFLPPFEAAVKQAGARVVMASYNEVDGLPSHANPWLLNDVLRSEWGFEGAVIGDYFAIDQLHELHHLATSLDEAAALALQSGVDSDLPNGASYLHLAEAVRAGRVPVALVDQAVSRMLDLKFRAGLFEEGPADADAAEALTHNADAQALALHAAERCIVLLKNDGTLPLRTAARAGRKPVLGVIGPNAAVARLGSYSGEPPQTVSLLGGLRARLGDAVDLRHAEGVRLTEGDDWWADEVRATPHDVNQDLIREAVALAHDCDCIVLALGDDERTAREAWAAHHLGDRAGIGLPGQQMELFDALHATGRPIVVVFINGRPVSEPRLTAQAHAIVQAGFLGEQGGPALARVLAGDVNPGGKLPLSIAQHVGTLPVFYNHKPSARRGYLFDEVRPLWPFGFGLSYTRFEFGAPQLSSPSMGTGGQVQVSVTVRNAGDRAGDEVVQLYVRDLVATVTRPVLELKGFQRVSLAPGQATTVSFTLKAEALAFWNTRMQRVVEPGDFDIGTGPDSTQLQRIRLQVTAD
jgi:beta-glucosidase